MIMFPVYKTNRNKLGWGQAVLTTIKHTVGSVNLLVYIKVQMPESKEGG